MKWYVTRTKFEWEQLRTMDCLDKTDSRKESCLQHKELSLNTIALQNQYVRPNATTHSQMSGWLFELQLLIWALCLIIVSNILYTNLGMNKKLVKGYMWNQHDIWRLKRHCNLRRERTLRSLVCPIRNANCIQSTDKW